MYDFTFSLATCINLAATFSLANCKWAFLLATSGSITGGGGGGGGGGGTGCFSSSAFLIEKLTACGGAKK